jgi:hypothetical protein
MSSVSSVSTNGWTSNGTVPASRVDIKKFLSGLSDEDKEELSNIIKDVESNGSDTDVDSLVSNASDSLKEAFSNSGLQLTKFIEGTQRSVENDGKMPPPPPDDENSGANLSLSLASLFGNVVSSLSDDGKTELSDIISEAKSGVSDLASLINGASDEVTDAFSANGLELSSFLTNLTKQYTSDYSSSFGKSSAKKPLAVNDMLELLKTADDSGEDS